MKTPPPTAKRTLRDIEDVGEVMKGLFDEIRLQAHLAAMELEGNAGPYLAEVRAASKDAARDLVKRGKQLKAHLKELRTRHATR